MTTPGSDTIDFHVPVTSAAELERRVAETVGRALSRQLWIHLFDDAGLQVPAVIPIGDLPARPRPGEGAGLGRALRGITDELDVDQVAFVFERPGTDTVGGADRAWLSLAIDAAAEADLDVFGLFVSHTGGVRTVGLEDLV
jgi:hypothetical protein